MSPEPIPEQVYRDAAYAQLCAVKTPADVDWYASMPGHRAAVESAYRDGYRQGREQTTGSAGVRRVGK